MIQRQLKRSDRCNDSVWYEGVKAVRAHNVALNAKLANGIDF